MTRGDFAYAMRARLYRSQFIRSLPALIHESARSGDVSPFAQGLWLFEGCVDLGANESHGDERFWFEGNQLRFEIEHYNQAGCQGPMDLQEMRFEVNRVGHGLALYDGQPVIANRTELIDPDSGEEVKQIWYFDDSGDVPRMAHGNFSSGNDILGYPREFHTETFTFQVEEQ